MFNIFKNQQKKEKPQSKGFVYCHWCQTALIDWHVICPHCGMPIINNPPKGKK